MSTSLPAAPPAIWREYLALTKPKVVSLLLFTAVGAMFVAVGGLPNPWALLGVLVGGYMSTGGAGVFNMILDRDIDAGMRRTKRRPLVTGSISVPQAAVFGGLLSAGSFVVLLLTTNLLTALLAWAGLLFYVLVYTAWLKRATWQNIVIGGAAGAVLPLLGWAAVTDSLPWMAWILFLLIFMWTPVHFWALTVLTTLAPFVLREAGWSYLGAVVLLNGLLVVKMVQLYARTAPSWEVARPDALSVYKFSMLYLALVFVALALARGLPFLP